MAVSGKRRSARPPDAAPLSHAVAPQSGLDVRQLRAFVTLVEVGRMTAAAQTLGLAQSTVSEALASLERAVGATVIIRGRQNGQTQLTPAGHALLPHARAILDAVGNAHLAVASTLQTARTRMDIIANESVSTYVLPGALTQLRASWPNTRFSVSVGTCAVVRDGVDSGDFDLGLLLDRYDRKDPSARAGARHALHSDNRHVLSADVRLVIFAQSGHPLVRRSAPTPIRRVDLAAYPLFLSDAAGDFHALVRHFLTAERVGRFKLEATGTVEGVKRAVSAGTRAIGILPAYAVAEELRLNTFASVDLRPDPPRMQLDALLSTSRSRHPATDELLTAIRRACTSATSDRD